MVWLVLTVGVLNLGLGYLAAVSLGPSPPWVAWRPRWPQSRWRMATRRRVPARAQTAPDDDTQRDAPEGTGATGRRDLPPPEFLADLRPSWQALLQTEGIVVRTNVEAAAQALCLEGRRYREQLVASEKRARFLLAAGDSEGLKLLADDLRFINQAWLENQTAAAELLAARACGAGQSGALAERWEQVLLDQAAEIQAACTVLQSLDGRTEAEINGKLLLEQIGVLVDQAHLLRDQFQEGLATLLASDERLDALEDRLAIDPLTGLLSRLGVEALLAARWSEDPQRKSPLSVVLVDIDRFSRVNQRMGTRCGDRTLTAMARLVEEMLPTDAGYARAARLAGQTFCVLLGDTLPQTALPLAERLRQAVEATTFDDQGAEFELTLSCGVIDGSRSDSVAALVRRANETVKFAKKAGRNRCAIDDGKGPTTQEPPQFPVKGRVVRLGEE